MLGAEGVKNLVIDRLAQVTPNSLDIRRGVVGATVDELPDFKAYYPAPQLEVPAGMYPYVTVHVNDTPGEVSNVAPPPGQTELVQEYQLEYNLEIMVNAWSSEPRDSGAFRARLQAERLALACREALLQDREMLTGRGEWDDWATVNYARWIEDYGVSPVDDNMGAWIGQAMLKVPVLAHEFLDTSPYRDNKTYIITSLEVMQADPITGAIIPETVSDKIDGGIEPKPEGI